MDKCPLDGEVHRVRLVDEKRVEVDGKFKIIPTHYEFLEPPEGVSPVVDLGKFITFIQEGTGYWVAQRMNKENESDASLWGMP